jgi:hypothetical protein
MDPELMSDALDDLAADAAEQQAQQAHLQAQKVIAEFRARFGDAALVAMFDVFHPGYRPTEAQVRGMRANLRRAGFPVRGRA